MKICSIEECDSPERSLGLCEKHYYRLRRTGTTDKKIPCDMVSGSLFSTRNFGPVEIVEYKKTTSVHVRFINTGYEASYAACQIRDGNVRDKLGPRVFGVGFAGIGPHKQFNGKKPTKAYSRWRDMLRRCYDKNMLKKTSAYAGCSVCDEWHNFQNFADWFCQYFVEGCDLDKDILSGSVKIYSPATCLFVTPEENSLEVNGKRHAEYSITKKGRVIIFRNITKTARELQLRTDGLCRLVNGSLRTHKGWSLTDA
jgi:hypothetical protein